MTYRYISNFARTQGAKDKKERKRRNVGGYTAGAVGAGLAGAGGAGYLGKNAFINKISKEAVRYDRNIPRRARAAAVVGYGRKANKYVKGALAAGLAGAGLAAGLGAKAYLNRRANQEDAAASAAREARNQARYEGSLAGRSKAAVGALKQKAAKGQQPLKQ